MVRLQIASRKTNKPRLIFSHFKPDLNFDNGVSVSNLNGTHFIINIHLRQISNITVTSAVVCRSRNRFWVSLTGSQIPCWARQNSSVLDWPIFIFTPTRGQLAISLNHLLPKPSQYINSTFKDTELLDSCQECPTNPVTYTMELQKPNCSSVKYCSTSCSLGMCHNQHQRHTVLNFSVLLPYIPFQTPYMLHDTKWRRKCTQGE